MARPPHTQSQIEVERNRLGKVALGLFRKHGYEGVSLRKLAIEAGVSHAQPYSYFASKEELFAYLRAELITQFCDFILAPAVDILDPVDQIRSVLHEFVRFVVTHPDEYRLMFSLQQPDPRRYGNLFRARERLMQAMLDIFQRAIDDGSIKGDASVQAHIAWATVHGLLSLHASNQLVHGSELFALVAPAIDQIIGRPPDYSPRNPSEI